MLLGLAMLVLAAVEARGMFGNPGRDEFWYRVGGAVLAALIPLYFSFVWLRGGLAVFQLWRIGPGDPRIDGRAVLRRVRGRRKPSLFASGRALAVLGWLVLALSGVAFAMLFALPLSMFTACLNAESNPAYWPARYFWRKAKAYGAPAAAVARRVDGRPPFLLLRSFRDDGMPLQANWIFGDALHAAWLTFEEVLAGRLWRRGPVVAIGQPDEGVPRLGAAREYVAHDAWQGRVEELVAESGLIVLVVGQTPGVAWEFGRLVSLAVLDRVVIVLPPSDELEVQLRWSTFLEALPRRGTPFEPLWHLDVRGVTMITFPAEGRPFCYLAPVKNRAAYRAGIDLAGQQILGEPGRPKRFAAPRPAPPRRGRPAPSDPFAAAAPRR